MAFSSPVWVKSLASLFLPMVAGLGMNGAGFAQDAKAKAAEHNPPDTADVRIARALQDISAERIRATVEKLVSFHTRQTLSAQDDAAIAEGRGIGAAREWIKAEFERYSKACGGCLEVKSDSFTEAAAGRIPAPTQITNVYAVLKGTDPQSAKRIVLVTGHYDSRNSAELDASGDAPGANDDASGTAVSLECARVLSQQKFPATILFLTVAGEEQGLNGSSHFAQMAKQQGWDLEAVLNNDIVGGDQSAGQDSSVVRVFSEGLPQAATEAQMRRIRALGGENDSPSRELARYIAEVARTYRTGVEPRMIFRLDRYLRGGDHSAFNQKGFAAVRFTEFREDYNHQHQDVRTDKGMEYGDLAKFMNFEYVANVARLNAATLASLASGPAPPVEVRLVTKNLENDSTLTWESSPGGLATGYEVVSRATSSPTWESVFAVGQANRATLKLSKDNVIFAVRAVDAQGHRSLPVVPDPER